ILAIISIHLGILNLFPFPALDGGYIILMIIEFIIRKPINRQVLGTINQVGIAVLIVLMGFVVYNDIVNIGNRAELLKNLVK
ncbi:site-2 protease family protein, partial [Candidatus Margulisiibacteriota bacterium]